MPQDFVRAAQRKLAQAARAALTELGKEIVWQIKSSISVPVQHVRGFGAIRSDPGEPPRKDTGTLYKSIKMRIDPGGESIENLVIYTTDPKAWLLEYGTANMEPRPFWAPARQRASTMKNRFKSLMAKHMATTAGGFIGDSADAPAAGDMAMPGD